MKIIILGPPGAGKGTQAAKICEKYGIVHISTGDIFRANISGGTPLGKKAKEYMDKGALVPDEVTLSMVQDRFAKDDCQKGYLLDGFPRTLNQAHALDELLLQAGEKIDCVLSIDVDYGVLVERITGRQMCACGATYHKTFSAPKIEGVCDKCGGKLYTRDDDKEETVVKRLEEYDAKTKVLIEYYQEKGILKVLDGSLGIEGVFAQICAILDALQ